MLGINLPDIILLGTLYPIIHFFLRDCDFQQQQRWCIVRGTSSKTSGFAGKLTNNQRTLVHGIPRRIRSATTEYRLIAQSKR